MAKDRQWLRQRLCTALGWDEVVVEGVVEAVASADSAEEIDALVQDYMGGGAQPKQLVQEFVRAQAKKVAASGSLQDTSISSHAQSAASSKHTADGHGQQSKKGAKEGQRQGGALTIKHTAARKGKAAAGRAGPPGSDLERKVVNCLSCGKVYDFRLAGAGQLTNDLLRFLEYGGLCTFCGAQVALSYGEQSQANATPLPSLQPTANPPKTPAPLQPTPSVSAPNAESSKHEEESKQADAIAFKNRLVGYDRNAAQRTKVIDDQSDYFEIDSNTWLSKQERDELKARARDEAIAQESRKKKVTVTVDLLGRQVLMSDSAEARQLESAADPRQSTLQMSASEIPSTSSSSATAAAASGPTPQSGSHALRIASNPNLLGPPPMFVKQPMQQLADSTPGANASGDQNRSLHVGGSRAAGNMQQPQAEGQHCASGQAAGKGRGSSRAARGTSKQQLGRPARLQHDDPFLAYDIVVA